MGSRASAQLPTRQEKISHQYKLLSAIPFLPSNGDIVFEPDAAPDAGRPFCGKFQVISTDHGIGIFQVVPASSAGKPAETRLRAAHSDVARRHRGSHPRAA